MHRRISIALTLLIGLFPAAPLAAQPDDNAHYFRRCEGLINGALGIVMYLRGDGGGVRGFYYYASRREVLFLRGAAGDTGEIVLFEFPRAVNRRDDESRTGEFRGTWSPAGGAARLRGVWRSPDGKKALPFAVTEKYGGDGVAFRPMRLDVDAPLFPGKAGSPEAGMRLSFLYPGPFRDDRVLAALRRLFADPHPDDPAKALRSYADKFVADYRESAGEENAADDDPRYRWEYSSSHDIVLDERGLLCAGMSVYTYTGGAHGSAAEDFKIIDLTSGRTITVADVFLPGRTTDLERLVRAQAREYVASLLQDGEGRDADEESVSSAFFDENFGLTDNMYLAVDGVGFRYQAAEITPYVMGPIDVFLPWKKIAALVKPDSPVRRIMPK